MPSLCDTAGRFAGASIDTAAGKDIPCTACVGYMQDISSPTEVKRHWVILCAQFPTCMFQLRQASVVFGNGILGRNLNSAAAVATHGLEGTCSFVCVTTTPLVHLILLRQGPFYAPGFSRQMSPAETMSTLFRPQWAAVWGTVCSYQKKYLVLGNLPKRRSALPLLARPLTKKVDSPQPFGIQPSVRFALRRHRGF